MSAHLAAYGLGLDLRTKEEGRRYQEKIYDGGEWQVFCEGGKQSPPGAKIIAELMLVVAKHFKEVLRLHDERLQAAQHAPQQPTAGTVSTSSAAASSAPAARGGGRG
eukprot:6199473-Pleurochrysis_carterae.AAC.1